MADRYSGWLFIYHFAKQATSERLVAICRDIFANYGVADIVSSDGGPQFKGEVFELFLKKHGVEHRKSSADYPQSNGRAEVAVKTAKRLIMANTRTDGSLNSDAIMRGLLQYRNTPVQGINLSPAQILLHRNLKDALPGLPIHYKMHKFWLEQAEVRLKTRQKEQLRKAEENDSSKQVLQKLEIGDTVLVQNKRTGKRNRWDRSGSVVGVRPNRQYLVQMQDSGRNTLRNRRHLRVVSQGKNRHRTGKGVWFPTVMREFRPSTESSPGATDQSTSAGSTSGSTDHPDHHPPEPTVPQQLTLPRVPLALSRLRPFNQPGLSET